MKNKLFILLLAFVLLLSACSNNSPPDDNTKEVLPELESAGSIESRGEKFIENFPQDYPSFELLEYVFGSAENAPIQLVAIARNKETGSSATLFVLDEPTTGLHSDDVKKLIDVLQRLVEHGDTVLVIEHNLDVIKCADQIIDMGPEGGQGGGTVICTGTPEKVAACKESYTGQYLKPMLEKGGDHGKSNCS